MANDMVLNNYVTAEESKEDGKWLVADVTENIIEASMTEENEAVSKRII